VHCQWGGVGDGGGRGTFGEGGLLLPAFQSCHVSEDKQLFLMEQG